MATNKERVEATKGREALEKDCREAVDVFERMKAERGGALERYHPVLASVGQIVKSHDERKDMTVDTLTTLRLFYKDSRTVAAQVQAVDVAKLRRTVTKLEEELKEKELQFQVFLGLAEENATMWSKVEGMCSAKT